MLKKNKLFKFLLLAAILIPIGIFIFGIDFQAVIVALQRIGPKFLWILLVTFFAYLLGSLGWWICLGEDRHNISLLKLFAIRQVGETVGLYNPSSIIGGDVLKHSLLKPYGIAKSITASSVVVSRITAVLSQVLLLCIALTWLFVNTYNQLSALMRYAFVGLMAVLLLLQVVFFYFLYRKSSEKKALESASKKGFLYRLGQQVAQLVAQSKAFFVQEQKLFWMSYAFFLLHWMVGSVEFYLILHFLGIDIRLIQGLLLDMGVILVKSAGAFVPGQIGVEELGNKLVLASIGVHATAIWISVSILRRTRQVCWIGIGGLCYTLILKQPKVASFNRYSHGDSLR